MKAVVRVALTYFQFAPLQSWLSALGLSLVCISLVVRVAAGAGDAALTLAILGAVLVSMGPVFGGGVMLRHASSRSTMMLRPNARLRLLLGTTLAMLVVVLLVTLPFLLGTAAGPGNSRTPSIADVFAIAWGAMALNWVSVFALSAYRYGLAFLWIVPVVVINLLQLAPPAELPDPSLALVAGLILWGAFAAWYLRQHIDAPSAVVGIGSASTVDATALPRFLTSASTALPRTLSGARRKWLLGEISLLGGAAIGAGSALMVVVLFLWVLDMPVGMDKFFMGNLLYVGLLISCFSGGFWLVGRSRTLWLRGGLDRAGLLRHVEISGLLPAIVSGLATALVIVLTQLWLRPELLGAILLNAVANLALAACMTYSGLSCTRSWSIETVLELLGTWVLGFAGILLLGPKRSPGFLFLAIASLALLALLLRARALSRWRDLDWRVKRPQMNPTWATRART